MTVIDCRHDDLPDILEMGKRFCKVADLEFNEETLRSTLINLIDNGICIRSQMGAIGGIVYPMFMSGKMVAQEFFWWSEDEKGLLLLQAFERKAKELGAENVIMVSLAKSGYNRVADIYKKCGYEFLESNFIKGL